LSILLKVGDTFTDETSTWEVVGRPVTARREGVSAKTQSPGQPQTRREHHWPINERVTVTRRAAP